MKELKTKDKDMYDALFVEAHEKGFQIIKENPFMREQEFLDELLKRMEQKHGLRLADLEYVKVEVDEKT